MIQPFDPGINQTILQANAAASAGGAIPDSANTVALRNTSATATAYFVCTPIFDGTAPAAAVIPTTGGVRGSLSVAPGERIRISVPEGPKAYRTIASAADGALEITPGRGN